MREWHIFWLDTLPADKIQTGQPEPTRPTTELVRTEENSTNLNLANHTRIPSHSWPCAHNPNERMWRRELRFQRDGAWEAVRWMGGVGIRVRLKVAWSMNSTDFSRDEYVFVTGILVWVLSVRSDEISAWEGSPIYTYSCEAIPTAKATRW